MWRLEQERVQLIVAAVELLPDTVAAVATVSVVLVLQLLLLAVADSETTAATTKHFCQTHITSLYLM